MLTPQLEEVARIWPSIDSVVSVPHTEEAYNRLVDFVHELVEEIGEDEEHPLASLLDTLETLIEAYETEHLPEPKGSPLETLKFLMDEHALGPDDLPEIGGIEIVSEILAEKRLLNVHHIRALSKRFNVSPSVFLDD